jgi:hypothetical protein
MYPKSSSDFSWSEFDFIDFEEDGWKMLIRLEHSVMIERLQKRGITGMKEEKLHFFPDSPY